MQGQITLVGYGADAESKLLRVEATFEGWGKDLIDVVSFPDMKVSIDRLLLLAAIEFLKTH